MLHQYAPTSASLPLSSGVFSQGEVRTYATTQSIVCVGVFVLECVCVCLSCDCGLCL